MIFLGWHQKSKFNQSHPSQAFEKWIEELSARQLLNPDAGAHLHHTQVSCQN